jgi:hypothetical protein
MGLAIIVADADSLFDAGGLASMYKMLLGRWQIA